MIKRATPALGALDLSRFSDTIEELEQSAAACEASIAALGRAQGCLKPGPLERFLVLLECDLAVSLDNQRALIAQLHEQIDTRIDAAITRKAPTIGGAA